MGEEWREAGRMMKKMNTFTDFIASAEHLIKNKYTSRGSTGYPGRQRRRLAGGRRHVICVRICLRQWFRRFLLWTC